MPIVVFECHIYAMSALRQSWVCVERIVDRFVKLTKRRKKRVVIDGKSERIHCHRNWRYSSVKWLVAVMLIVVAIVLMFFTLPAETD